MQTADLKPGTRARLLDFGKTDPTYRRKLLSLGVTKGVEVSVVRAAPLGCPVQIEVRGTSLTLRKEEAAGLIWEQL